MKKIILSAVAASLAVSTLSAGAITLYQDKNSGAIYTKPGPDRVELGDFVSAKEQYVDSQTTLSKLNKKLGVKVKAKVPLLKFSGKHYIGYTYTDDKTAADEDSSTFETRRNYFQVKAYWNKHDYMRITLDTHQNAENDWAVRLKYAYIFISDILPYTGVEFGQSHRSWIDWEEHHGWWYRSISKTFIEDKHGADLTNSADIGINFKTKTPYFSSEIGVYNGEGYHGKHEGTEMSYEWRLTANVLGTGKKKVHMDDEYFDVSFLGQYNNDNYYKNDAFGNPSKKQWWGIHAVYNQPQFLIAGMYVDSSSSTYNSGKGRGNGYSVNGEFRPVEKWSILGRYDYWEVEKDAEAGSYAGKDKNQYIAGVAYDYNKNVKLIGNVTSYDDKVNKNKADKFMFTAEVHW